MTGPSYATYVLCWTPSCMSWALSQGLQPGQRGVVPVRKGPMRPRGKPRCDYCGKERPPKRHCLVNDEGQLFCSLTCRSRAARVGQ